MLALCTASLLVSRELTNRRLSHDGAVGSPYSPASSSLRNLNLRFAVKTTTFMRDQQIFPPFLKFVFVFWQGELFKPKCLTSEKRELYRVRLWKQLYKRTRIYTFVRLSQVNKSRVSVLELRHVRFRREIRRRLQGRVSFLQGGHL